MRMTIKGNEASIAVDQDKALDLASRLIQGVQKARRHGRSAVTCVMPINVDGESNDRPGVVSFEIDCEGP
jgi:hypothetical protein